MEVRERPGLQGGVEWHRRPAKVATLERSEVARGLVELGLRGSGSKLEAGTASRLRFASRTKQDPTGGANLEQQHGTLLEPGVALRSGPPNGAVRRRFTSKWITPYVGFREAFGGHRRVSH